MTDTARRPSDRLSPGSALRSEATRAAGGLPALLVEAERVASTVAQGVHGRRKVGVGDSFWQFRLYQPGDPLRRIDWRKTARSEITLIREQEWEAAQSVWLWRDSGSHMAYASSDRLPTKRRRADVLTLALADLLVRAGERVALLDGRLPPVTGRTALDRLALMLDRDQDADGESLPPTRALPRHAELVLLGAFLDPIEDVELRLAALATRPVRGHLVQILDPAEETLPFDGRIRFEGFRRESPLVLSRVETVREAYMRRLTEQQEGLARIARTLGWSFSVHVTDRPATAALLALYGAMATPRSDAGRAS